MKFTFDHDLHIHSKFSLCSRDEEQSPENILQYAEDYGLSTICLTDHCWDESVPGCDFDAYQVQNYPYICQSKPLPQSKNVRFLFGCETEVNQFLTVGMSRARCDEMDFVIVPITHMHFPGFTISHEDGATAQTRAKAWVKRFERVLDSDLPFHKIGMAHLTCALIARERETYLETLRSIPSADMEKLFKKAATLGAGIELNANDMAFSDDETDVVLRPYHIAKDCGCKFYCGSDAHRPKDFAKVENFARAIDLLGLDETDKFRI